MKKLFLLLLLTGLLLTGCGEDNTNPGGNTPVTGTYEFVMEKVGWIDQQEATEITVAPGLTISPDVGNNASLVFPKYYKNETEGNSLRLYQENTVTFSANNLTRIEFKYNRYDGNQEFTPNVGSLTSDHLIWTGEASSVTFTVGNLSGKQIRIGSIKVTGTFSGEGGTPVDPGEVRTIESIANDIANSLNLPASSIEWDDNEEAYIDIAFSNMSSLKEACETGITYLPKYLTLDTAPYAGTWQEGDDGYFAYYVDSTNAIYVEIGSYFENNIYSTQFCVFYGY